LQNIIPKVKEWECGFCEMFELKRYLNCSMSVIQLATHVEFIDEMIKVRSLQDKVRWVYEWNDQRLIKHLSK